MTFYGGVDFRPEKRFNIHYWRRLGQPQTGPPGWKAMGVSSWSYFVPYQKDIQAALTALRMRVFQTSEYLDPDAYLLQVFSSRTVRKKFIEQLPGDLKKEIKEGLQERRSKKPSSIDELVERAGESGTHSILDIQRVEPRPARGAAAPLTQKQLRKLFGTTKPTREQLVARLYDLMNLRSPWRACYVVVYRGSRPREICFAGSSGE